MPFLMLHLCVAGRLESVFSPESLPHYYLGALAPDASANREGYTLTDRARAHFAGEGGQSCSRAAAIGMFSEYKHEPEKSFFTGYAVHLLTDALWEEEVFARFLKDYEASGADMPMRKAYTGDMAAIDMRLYLTKPFAQRVKQYLDSAHAIGLAGVVSEAEVEMERARTYPWYEKRRGGEIAETRFISYEDAERFIEDAVNDIAERCR